MKTRAGNTRQGFTLLEIAVVLTVIALIVGGIIGGKRLLQQGQLQAVISDLVKTRSAVDQFKKTYGGLPGDIADATSYWGTDATDTCAPNNVFGTIKVATCDGNNNGSLGDGGAAPREVFRAWQQLSNAGLVTGTFTGVANGDNVSCASGLTCGAGKMDNSFVSLFTIGVITEPSAGTFWPGDWGTVAMVGWSPSPYNTPYPIFTPRDAQAIDAKMDDGMPATGKIFVARSITGYMSAGVCVSNITGTIANTLTTQYMVSLTTANSCDLGVKLD